MPIYDRQDTTVTVIALDGPSGTGKGSTRTLVARHLGFHELDSGCLYRAVALATLNHKVSLYDTERLTRLCLSLNIRVEGIKVFSNDVDVTSELRSQRVANEARVVGQIPQVREALLHYQLSMRRNPGLVADGRDMGEIFLSPNCYRYYITTLLDVKALRQCAWIKQNEGRDVLFETVREEMYRRDLADKNRAVSPLRIHPEAVLVDNTQMTKEETAEFILKDFDRRSKV